jgi:hypothetical protein
MAKKQSQASGEQSRGTAEERSDWPKQGEHYHCDTCGMEIEIMTDCHCQTEDGPHLECCGQELARV